MTEFHTTNALDLGSTTQVIRRPATTANPSKPVSQGPSREVKRRKVSDELRTGGDPAVIGSIFIVQPIRTSMCEDQVDNIPGFSSLSSSSYVTRHWPRLTAAELVAVATITAP